MRYFSLILFLSLIFCFDYNLKAQDCKVSMTLYRANMKPLANKLVTFKSDDENHHVEVITKENGFCKVKLMQNVHYNIIFQDIIYKDLIKIPKSEFLDYTGPMLIDGGLFSIVKMEVLDSQGDYSLLKNETIICESKSTGELYEQKTDENGIVEFYVPRNSTYLFHSVYERNIQTVEIRDASGISVYTVSLKAYTVPESQYHQRIIEAEQEALAWIRQMELEDSLKGTIAINVLLFLNIEPKSNNGQCSYLGKVNIYDSPKKNKQYGHLKGNWSVKGICENDYSLCMNSVTNKDGSYSDAVLPLKLKRGIHHLYVEDEKGDFKETVEVVVKIRKSYNYLKNNYLNYYITSPLCITNN